MTSARNSYDVVVVGGGHNGLVAAAYLARAGLSTLVLERLPHTGGAARHACLVSLIPESLIGDLGLDLSLESRSVASFTPTFRDGTAGGLLVERQPGARTEQSFHDLTGGDAEYAAWQEFYADVADLAHTVAPTLLQPLPVEREIKARVDPGIWRDFVTTPLGVTIESRFADDTVRGVVASDATIGTFASLHDPTLAQNRSFLHRLIGNGTGEWQVPVGGMGVLSDALARAASDAGAEIVTSAGVSAIRGGDDAAEVTWHDGSTEHTVGARFVLSNVAPWVLRILLGETEDAASKPEGAQLTLNLLLDRLPRLRSGVDPEVAFAGTLHLGAGLHPARGGVRRRLGRPVPVGPARRGPLPVTHRRLGLSRHPHADVHRQAHPGPAVRRRPVGLQGPRGRPRAGVDRRAPGRTDRGLPGPGRGRQTAPRGGDAAGRRARAGDAGRTHPPRRPRVAVGLEPGAAGHTGAAVGRADRPRLGARLRLRIAPRRRRLRPRRTQRRARRTGLAVRASPRFFCAETRW